MSLLRFFRSAKWANWNAVMVMSVISGLAGGAVLAIVNTATTEPSSDRSGAAPDLQLVLLFLLAIAIYAFSKRWSVLRTAHILEQLVTELRLRVCDKLRRTELEVVEGLDKAEAFAAVTQDASRIAQSGFLITNTAQQAVVLVAGAAYLAWLSPVAFLLFVTGAAFAIWQIISHRESLMEAIRKDMEK